MLLASVIIPHCGPQELLDRCLASIPTRDDVQIVVIYDNDRRGAGWARNKGLEKAEGKYIIFADSDDFFHPCFNEFLDRLKSETADVVFFNADSIESETGKPSWRSNHLNRIISSKDTAWQERHLRYHFTEPWCRAVKRSLIDENHIRFSESRILNDIYFSTQQGIFAKTISVYDAKCYCICNCPNSVSRQRTPDTLLDYTREVAKANILLKKHGISRYHSRMLRPFFYAILHAWFSCAVKCWQAVREEGFTYSRLLLYLFRYPCDVVKLIMRKIQAGEMYYENSLRYR